MEKWFARIGIVFFLVVPSYIVLRISSALLSWKHFNAGTIICIAILCGAAGAICLLLRIAFPLSEKAKKRKEQRRSNNEVFSIYHFFISEWISLYEKIYSQEKKKECFKILRAAKKQALTGDMNASVSLGRFAETIGANNASFNYIEDLIDGVEDEFEFRKNLSLGRKLLFLWRLAMYRKKVAAMEKVFDEYKRFAA